MMLQRLLILLTALMPVAIMSSQTIPSGLFYAAALAGLVLLITQRFAGASGISKTHGWVLLCMAAPTLAVLASALAHGHLVGLDLEVALRFFLGFWLLLLAYRAVHAHTLSHGMWGFMAATAVAAAYILWLAPVEMGRPQTSAIYNAVGYGSLSALLMALCVYALRLPLMQRWITQLLLILLALAALIAVVMTQTRTAWMAIPVFVIIAAILFVPPQKPGRIVAAAVLALVALSSIFAFSDTLQGRVALAYQEATECTGDQSTTDTSICTRFQLWRSSLDMLSKRPWAGTGSKRYFNDYLVAESMPQGLASPYVAENWGEPHNDLLLYLASFGWPGGLALLLIYLGPACVFARRLLGAGPPEARAAAAMGLAVCLGFLIFGLTETMFRSMRTVSFYTLCVAFFMAWSEATSGRKPSASA